MSLTKRSVQATNRRTRRLFSQEDCFYEPVAGVAYHSANGILVHGDCLKVLPVIRSSYFDTIFADPPFNLGKRYGKKSRDSRSNQDYLTWCFSWLRECIRVLKDGGSLFIYNMPFWNIYIAQFLLSQGLIFRDWIVVDVKNGLPIHGRLYPSHYSMVYFSKGKNKTFHNIRRPIEVCRHCGKDIHHYGGHRDKLNPKGVNLTDVWADISPVRHSKFKSSKRGANALSTKLLERVIMMSTEPGDVVLDPFGGSGTTYAVCNKRQRRWVGIEINATRPIIDRISKEVLDFHKNTDHFE